MQLAQGRTPRHQPWALSCAPRSPSTRSPGSFGSSTCHSGGPAGKMQRQALYGPMPVQTRTFGEIFGHIGPYEFQGKSIWTNRWVPCFQEESAWTDGRESSSKDSPQTGTAPCMALPRDVSQGKQGAVGVLFWVSLSHAFSSQKIAKPYSKPSQTVLRTDPSRQLQTVLKRVKTVPNLQSNRSFFPLPFVFSWGFEEETHQNGQASNVESWAKPCLASDWGRAS